MVLLGQLFQEHLNTGRYILGSCGTQTAGLACGGYNGSTNVNNSEEYNGTSWSEGNNLNTTRRTLTGLLELKQQQFQ